MIHHQTSIIAALLAAFLLPMQTHGSSFDLTIRFLPEPQDDTCSYDSTSTAITFTTASVPIIDKCFDLAEIFNGSATQGYVNQSHNLAGSRYSPVDVNNTGIRWKLENADAFDPSANYSNVMYRYWQGSSEGKEDRLTPARAAVYGVEGCLDMIPGGPKDERGLGIVYPWYGFSCETPQQGGCGQLPIAVKSFRIDRGVKQDTCWDFAKQGSAARMGRNLLGVVGVGVAAVAWLGL